MQLLGDVTGGGLVVLRGTLPCHSLLRLSTNVIGACVSRARPNSWLLAHRIYEMLLMAMMVVMMMMVVVVMMMTMMTVMVVDAG